jgi:hypothetical protein
VSCILDEVIWLAVQATANDKHRDDANAAGVIVLPGKPYPEEELITRIQLATNPTRIESGWLAQRDPGGTRSRLEALVILLHFGR